MEKNNTEQLRVIRQFQFEVENWGRQLVFYREDLVYFKNRLAEIVETIEDTEELQSAERFGEDFVAQDKILSYLLAELKRQEGSLRKDLYLDGELFNEVVKQQRKLRKDFRKEEELFTTIKNSFVQFLTGQY